MTLVPQVSRASISYACRYDHASSWRDLQGRTSSFSTAWSFISLFNGMPRLPLLGLEICLKECSIRYTRSYTLVPLLSPVSEVARVQVNINDV